MLLCFTLATCIWDWYAADNKLPGTGHGSSRRPKAGKSPTCCHPATAFRGHFQKGIFVAWQGNSMVCVNQTRLFCVNQMGNTQSKALAQRHGMCESALKLLPWQLHWQPCTRQAHIATHPAHGNILSFFASWLYGSGTLASARYEPTDLGARGQHANH
jgi:hypothetical protein